MAALNFKDIANKKLEEVERPPLPPVGTYLFQVSKVPAIETLTGDKWDVVDFPLKALAPTDDVDADAIAAYGKVEKINLRHRFMFNKEDKVEFEASVFRLRQFLENTLKCAEPSMSLTEALGQANGKQLLASVVWKADKQDPELMHANIGRTAPVE